MDQLIVGLKGQGKSTLMMELVRQYKGLGLATAALTPIDRDLPRWQAAGVDFVTKDRAKLLALLKDPRSWGVMVMIDEAGQTIGRHDREVEGFCAEARHQGHTLHFGVQRATKMNKDIRENCTGLFAFRQGIDDAETLTRTFGHKELMECANLDVRQFIHCTTSKGSVSFGRLS